MYLEKIKEFPSLIAETEDMNMEEVGQVVLGSAFKIAKIYGIEPKVVLRKGHAAAQILRFATEYGPQMIFLGTRGRGPTTALIMGSVSQKVSEEARVPVVIVR